MAAFSNPSAASNSVPEVTVLPEPKIGHTHIWLPANDGKELVCGDCGKRQKV